MSNSTPKKAPPLILFVPVIIAILWSIHYNINQKQLPLLSKENYIDTTNFEFRPGRGRGGMTVADSLTLAYNSLVLIDTPTTIQGWNKSWVENSQFDFSQLETPFSIYKSAGSDTVYVTKDQTTFRFLLIEIGT